MRTFLSIEFDNNLKEQIMKLQEELKNYIVKGKWKHKNNFHLTLKFLGEIGSEKVSAIIDRFQENPVNIQKFKLRIENLGRFGGDTIMRVLWLGLGGETKFLSNLKDIIDEELEPFGFLKEQRKYSPHITIAQDIIAKDNIEKFHEIFLKKEFNSISVNAFHLMRSEHTGRKQLYTRIETFKLN